MSIPSIQAAFVAGELAPQLYGRVDFAKYAIGLSTARNGFIRYTGGISSRAGTKFVGYSKQTQLNLAAGSIFFGVIPSNGDTVTLNGRVFTFVTAPGGWPNVQTNYEISIGGNNAGTIFFLNEALTSGATYLADSLLNVATYSVSLNSTLATLFVSSKASGTSGDSYTLAASAATVSGPNLTGGGNFPPRLITFQFNLNQGFCLEFGQQYMRVISDGAFVTETPLTITGITQANPAVVTFSGGAFNSGDWAFIAGVGGMTQVNGETYVLSILSSTTAALLDVFGNNIDSTGFGTYISGGAIARIYTLATPYQAADLPYIKFVQSADVMSLCCRNQITSAEYPPYDLDRLADDNWTLTQLATGSSIAAPTGLSGTATVTTVSNPTDFQYVVTQVDSVTGDESIASNIADINDSVDIATTAGSIELAWTIAGNAAYSNVYKAPPAYASTVPVGSLFGLAGSVLAPGDTFVDSNIVEDLTTVPPTHQAPFSGGIASGDISWGVGEPASGNTFTLNGALFTFVTSGGTTSNYEFNTGSSTISIGGILAGQIVPYLNSEPTYTADARLNGATYSYSPAMSPTELVITFNTPGSAGNAYTLAASRATPSGPTLTGGISGGVPSVPSYFQERRVYANTGQQPDTYWMSQPGSFTDFDTRTPTIDSDAITGTPWSVQVNGIQFMIPLLGSLVVLTGQAAYLLGGVGTSPTAPQPITPSSQQSLPQAFNGCNTTVAPIQVDYDVYYIQSKGSIVRNLSFNFWINVMTGVDATYLSSHLFTGHILTAMAWCEEPYKVVWCIRDDGAMLSLTTLKSQDVMGWARHDTQGLFVGCTAVTEPPVDALYVATQRFLPAGTNPFMIERMDNRIWPAAEDCWCVDAGLELGQGTPSATLTITGNPNGAGIPHAITVLTGGTFYSSGVSATLDDPTGSGCTLAVALGAGGVITAITPTGGTLYTNPVIIVTDTSSGAGFTGAVTLDNSVTLTTDSAVFSSGNVGDVVRAGGGIMQITAYTNSKQVTAAVVSPIVDIIPGTISILPFQSGDWTQTTPVSTITGLNHLNGLTVTGLADGNVITPTVVSGGAITLANASSAVIVGLPFQAQAQTLYLNGGNPTEQGRRKKVGAATVRLTASGSVQVGTNQPDGSVQSPMALQTTWTPLSAASTSTTGLAQVAYGATTTILNTTFVRPVPLYTGDIRVQPASGFEKNGQVAVQQLLPLPMDLVAVVRESDLGDSPEMVPRKGPSQMGPQQ